MPRGDRFASRSELAGRSPFTGDPTCRTPPSLLNATAPIVAETASPKDRQPNGKRMETGAGARSPAHWLVPQLLVTDPFSIPRDARDASLSSQRHNGQADRRTLCEGVCSWRRGIPVTKNMASHG